MSVDFRYRRLGYIALNVTDVERTSAFAADTFALDPSGTGPNGERFFRCGQEHHSIVLTQASEPGFVRGGWEMESEEDVDRAFAHFDRLGLKPVKLSQEERAALGIGLGEAFRVREPTVGACFEYYARMVTLSRPRSIQLTDFQHIGHYGIGVPDVRKSTKFALEEMGFRASDFVGDLFVAFMRSFPNPNHHSFAYLPTQGPNPTFNHVAFMVGSIDDIGKLFNRVEVQGVQRAWGIGRHPTSNSIHLYINDPDGIVWEYTLGMEQFPEHDARQARYMSAAPEDSDLWGAKPKPSMMSNIGVITADAA